MEEITTELPPETDVADVAADLPEPASMLSRFEQGRRWYDEQGRPLSREELEDASLMSGWFHQWGYTDAMTLTPPLFMPEVFPLAPYMAGWNDGAAFTRNAELLQNVADGVFEQYCEQQGWDDEFIQQNCGVAEEYVCDRDAVTFLFAKLGVPETVAVDEADYHPDAKPLTVIPEPTVVLAVKFSYADGAFTLAECMDCAGEDPVEFAVDRAALPEPLTEAELAELKQCVPDVLIN